MAGSPGAGKTEFAKRYIPSLIKEFSPDSIKKLKDIGININDVDNMLIRLDVDEIRLFLLQYIKTDLASNRKGNAHVIQKAANLGLDVLRDYCLANNLSFLQDGTFSNYETMKDLIKKSIQTMRSVQIYYLYRNPVLAWEYTKAREFIEGRNILKENFLDQFFKCVVNIDKIKSIFKDEVDLWCIVKEDDNSNKFYMNIANP